jgi:hypothetical protein
MLGLHGFNRHSPFACFSRRASRSLKHGRASVDANRAGPRAAVSQSAQVATAAAVGNVPTNWTVQGVNADEMQSTRAIIFLSTHSWGCITLVTVLRRRLVRRRFLPKDCW